MEDREKDMKKVEQHFYDDPEKAKKYYERSQNAAEADWEEYKHHKEVADSKDD